MSRVPASLFCVVVTCASLAAEQAPPRAPRTPPPATPAVVPMPPAEPQDADVAALNRSGRPVNIRFDVAIVDEGGPQPLRKLVSLTLADRQSGSVRAAVLLPGVGSVPLGVDATPMVQSDGRVRARISVSYRPGSQQQQQQIQQPNVELTFGILLEDGKKIVASQAADPTTDRRISVEVTATVLK
jgi:hypothetical protein